ncbi:MAG: hypothetical protein VB064_05005 [Oscillospiraceae bacterium]|nr:hypothetical protein [Oscillospiraceae bacterium]
MTIWWESLTLLEKIAAGIAFPATLILLIQIVMQLFGLDGGPGDGLDVDVDGDGIQDAGEHGDFGDSGAHVFTIRGFVTFFTIFGWSFLALSRSGASSSMSLLVSFILGVCAMVITGFIIYWALKLQSDGTVNYSSALGLTGRVYIPIPPDRTGTGKVNVLIQERYCECDAVSDEEQLIETDCEVVVTGVTGRNTLIVRRKQPVKNT